MILPYILMVATGAALGCAGFGVSIWAAMFGAFVASLLYAIVILLFTE